MPIHNMSFTLLISLRPFFFTASSLSNWLFGLEYNSLSVSHILAQETSALITTRPCYYWKGTTDSPRGQPCVSDWILKKKTPPPFFWCQALSAKHSVTLGKEMADYPVAHVTCNHEGSPAPPIHIYPHKDRNTSLNLRITHCCCQLIRSPV